MKNFNIFKNLYLTIVLLCSACVFSQQMIEQNSGGNPTVTTSYKYHLDESNYTKITNVPDRTIYLGNISSPQNETQNTEDNVTLSINLNFDPDEFMFMGFVMVYNESGYMNYGFWTGSGPISLEVPGGTYDYFTQFYDITTGKIHMIVKEQKNTDVGTTIDINPDEAMNLVSTKLLDENGEPLQPGILNSETGGYSAINYTRINYFLPLNLIISGATDLYDTPFGEHGPTWDFYINDVSDRYSFTQNLIAHGNEENNHYFCRYSTITGITESVLLQNDPSDWVFHTEKFQPSLLGMNGEVYPAFLALNSYNGNVLGQLSSITMSDSPFSLEEGFRAYLNNPLDEDPAGLLIFPGITDHIAVLDPGTGEEGFLMKGNAVTKDGDYVSYGSGALSSLQTHPYFLGSVYYIDESFGFRAGIPFHPRFSFTSEQNSDVIQGNNVPVSSVGSAYNIRSNYVGRYGEVRESDFFATEVEIKHEDEIVFSGNYIEDGYLSYSIPETGKLEFTFTNTNIDVDGLNGKNITRLSFDRSREDWASPTLQHLQFRNTDNKVTDRFETAEQGAVRLAAGDFKFTGSYASYLPGNEVQFFYSTYGQDTWTEIELNKIPEYFQMPAFGDYYEASLAGVVVPEENSWFDVKIICTDAAGNKQEQIVSPAFKVEQKTMGIEEVDQSGFTVYPNPFTNEVNIKLPESLKGNYTFKVSDLSGKKIYAQNQSDRSFVWNGSSLPKGIYILSIETNGKAIAKKVIKK